MHLRLCRNNPENWAGKTLPKAGSIVSFPDSFADFGVEDCDDLSDCDKGGRVSFRPAAGKTVQNVEMAALNFPVDGVFSFDGDTVLAFVETSGTPTQVTWADRGEHQFDFKCAANWVVTGSSKNPEFAFPCYQDIAVFNEVCW
jgi:hypothetical protein